MYHSCAEELEAVHPEFEYFTFLHSPGAARETVATELREHLDCFRTGYKLHLREAFHCPVDESGVVRLKVVDHEVVRSFVAAECCFKL